MWNIISNILELESLLIIRLINSNIELMLLHSKFCNCEHIWNFRIVLFFCKFQHTGLKAPNFRLVFEFLEATN